MTAEAARNLTEEETPNTHGVQHVIESGDEQEVKMILGDRERIRHAGIIRAGKKVLKGNPPNDLRRKFDELEAQGLSYDEIDRQLGGTPKSKNSKLRPTNVDYFIVRECDFRNSRDAAFIRDKYADPDGKVRRIPIWFTTDDIAKVIPHNFRAFDGGGKVRASSFFDMHGELAFRYLKKGDKDGKEWTSITQEDCGLNEEDLINHVAKLCGYQVNFGGMYRCNVVGLRTFGEVIVPTRSWYGLSEGVAILKRVRSILNRFSGLVGGQHFLVLTKVPEEVKTPDGKMQIQHIVTIDADVDPMELARHAEQAPARGMAALGMFNGGPVDRKPETDFYQETLGEPYQPEQEPTKPTVSEDAKRAQDAILNLATGKKGEKTPAGHNCGGISTEDFAAFCREHLGGPLEDEGDVDALRKFYGQVRDNIAHDADVFREHCRALRDEASA